MNIEDITIKQAKEIASVFSVGANATQQHPYKLGAVYQIRTVTFTYTGRLKAVYQRELVLEDAAWIADTGRFADACKTQAYNEIEPFPDGKPVIIGRDLVTDALEVNNVNRSQK